MVALRPGDTVGLRRARLGARFDLHAGRATRGLRRPGRTHPEALVVIRRVLVLFVVLVSLTAACSSGSDHESTTTTSTSHTSTSTAPSFRGIRLVPALEAEQPTSMTWCPDGSSYISQRTGQVVRAGGPQPVVID